MSWEQISVSLEQSPRFTIVGSGLAGALMACYLGRAGYHVDLYEKRADPRRQQSGRDRSINLAISVRGLHALGEVGLADEVLRAAIPMRGRMIHNRDGNLTFQPYGKNDAESIDSVSRADLNIILLNAAEKYSSVKLHFDQRCVGVDLATAAIQLRDQSSGQITKVDGEIVIGADGAYSAVRASMLLQDRFNFQQEYLTHGYKELTMPARAGGAFAMAANALHIWPRKSFMMIALPNRDGSFTCTLFWPFEGPNSFAALGTADEVIRYFSEQFPDVVPLMPNLVEDFLCHPTGSLVTMRCHPWHVRDRIVLLGDAAHAVVPFLGQGMNTAFEDCTILSRCLQDHAPNWERAFDAFEAARKRHTDTLAQLCVDNFIEMRDRVGSRTFILKKKADLLLSKLFPRWYIPLYTLISFSRMPYADAVRRTRMQDRIVLMVAAGIMLALLLWFINR